MTSLRPESKQLFA